MSTPIVPNFPANPIITMPIHGEFGWGESAVSWAAWCLRDLSDYEEASKLFCLGDKLVHRTWRDGSGKRAGSDVGYYDGKGYLRTRFKGRHVQVHNLVWLLTYGHWPRKPLVLDHVNGTKDDNRISNLRELTTQWNNLLGARAKTGSTLPYGVSIATKRDRKDTYARAQIEDKAGKPHNHRININDPSTREAAIATCSQWWWAKHKEFHPRREDYAPTDTL